MEKFVEYKRRRTIIRKIINGKKRKSFDEFCKSIKKTVEWTCWDKKERAEIIYREIKKLVATATSSECLRSFSRKQRRNYQRCTIIFRLLPCIMEKIPILFIYTVLIKKLGKIGYPNRIMLFIREVNTVQFAVLRYILQVMGQKTKFEIFKTRYKIATNRLVLNNITKEISLFTAEAFAIKSQISKRKKKKIKYVWIAEHNGIEGNTITREANFKRQYFTRYYRKMRKKSWFYKMSRERYYVTLINKLRANHFNLNKSLARKGIIESARCECSNDSESLEHYLWQCFAIEPLYNKKLISEIEHIKKQKHGINRQNVTESLPEAYSRIIHSLSSS
ncbi:hypothetical protein ALC56_09107 [Trachymyrmex septentrionalis]|uniref:Uncharacterized protein n=1 Tax=Trachymyrmex septentrionalis TaxID=34720 RepID=A0A151JUW9_9HYME|nr:hypothetical protein ALC56_09107 [Trachymyrmex septentrionalis]